MRPLLLLLLIFSGLRIVSEAQTCKVKAYSTASELCSGDSIQLYATGGCQVLYSEDFNSSWIPSNLTITGAPTLANPCGPGIDNTPYLWMGSGTVSPRSVTTQAFNTTTGACKICFDMKYGIEGQASPCEGPNLSNEGVRLQYSTNGGASWTDIQYWNPNGGNDSLLVNWGTRCVNIPGAAISIQTMFRWAQTVSLSNSEGHWGIDNLMILCNSNVSYAWSTGHTGSTTPWLKPLANTVYTVTMTNLGNSQTFTDTVGVKVKFTPSANFTVISPICKFQNSTITYTGNAGPTATFNWGFQSGGTYVGSGSGPYTATFNSPGDYDITLRVSDDGCESDLITQEILVEPLISFFVDKFNGCEPLSIHIDDNTTPNSANFLWNFHDPGSGASNTSTLPSPNHTYSTHGTFDITVFVTTPNGCADTLFIPDLITVYPKPIPDFEAVPPIAPLSKPTIQFNDKSQYTTQWNWNFGDPGSGSGNSSNSQNPSHKFGEGSFDVKLVASNAFGCTDSITKQVRVIDDILVIPNVITPNGDGFNDKFVIDNLEAVISGTLTIYNRYGRAVYQSNAYADDFDAKGLPDGVYYFIFNYSTYFGSGKRSGTITVFHQ